MTFTAARPFSAVDELKNVKGIGPKTFAEVAPLVAP
jgi:DNA uptake protein ComE-like DNA-binding protein